ncbi:hypothetical protein [Frankia sp. AgB32]|uniref:hypothetical protein n=1 Tax=Frankia sp. AgB32 TaxID=631119 RepID=UPI002010B63A|nr:hypothetical protein [Frankia sp. AgB32]MCK9895761.1 hypothetical protein [Frankia sp. AgB32]
MALHDDGLDEDQATVRIRRAREPSGRCSRVHAKVGSTDTRLGGAGRLELGIST